MDFHSALSRIFNQTSIPPATTPALVISSGFPSRHGEDAELKLLELVQALQILGCPVDLAVLLPERRLISNRPEGMEALSGDLHVFHHPAAFSPVWEAYFKVRNFLWGHEAGDSFDCPGPWLRQVAQLARRKPYDTVVVQGLPLVPLAGTLPPESLKVLDLLEVEGFSTPLIFESEGAPAPVPRVSPPRILPLLKAYDRVLVPARRDAQILRAAGYSRAVVLNPFLFSVDPESWPPAGRALPDRPPKILQVAGDSPDDLDSVRYFRRRILPRVRKRVPSARYRVVGAAGRWIEPGPDLDLLDFGSLEEEYSGAAAVIAPQRFGRRVRWRVVEALARGKALVATSVAAYGLELQPAGQALIADDAEAFADALARILVDAPLRQSLEAQARHFAEERLNAAVAVRTLGNVLGYEERLVSRLFQETPSGGGRRSSIPAPWPGSSGIR